MESRGNLVQKVSQAKDKIMNYLSNVIQTKDGRTIRIGNDVFGANYRDQTYEQLNRGRERSDERRKAAGWIPRRLSKPLSLTNRRATRPLQ